MFTYTYFISTLFLTHLAIPAQFLKAFGFDSVPNRFRTQKICFPHFKR